MLSLELQLQLLAEKETGNEWLHPALEAILADPALSLVCRRDRIRLPQAWRPSLPVKAIVIGGDPTNSGTPHHPGSLALEHPYGLGGPHEGALWARYRDLLGRIGLTKDELYVQYLCRTYLLEDRFRYDHWRTDYWDKLAARWLPYLRFELQLLQLPEEIPVIAISEPAARFLVPGLPDGSVIYEAAPARAYYSDVLGREVLPLFAHHRYDLGFKRHFGYREYLRERFKTAIG